jgi:hypothetical protein
MRKFINFTLLIISVLSANAQDKNEVKEGFFKKYPFVNITEFGGMLGRTKSLTGWSFYTTDGKPGVNATPYYYIERQANLTLQTFNGVYLNKKTAVGLTTGVDWIGTTVLMPIAAGVRRQLAQRKEGGSAIMANLDLGYATNWLNENNGREEVIGGIAINPSIGYRIPMRNGSAWLINFGYRHQRYELFTDNSYENGKEIWINQTTQFHKLNRMTAKLGFEF